MFTAVLIAVEYTPWPLAATPGDEHLL